MFDALSKYRREVEEVEEAEEAEENIVFHKPIRMVENCKGVTMEKEGIKYWHIRVAPRFNINRFFENRDNDNTLKFNTAYEELLVTNIFEFFHKLVLKHRKPLSNLSRVPRTFALYLTLTHLDTIKDMGFKLWKKSLKNKPQISFKEGFSSDRRFPTDKYNEIPLAMEMERPDKTLLRAKYPILSIPCLSCAHRSFLSFCMFESTELTSIRADLLTRAVRDATTVGFQYKSMHTLESLINEPINNEHIKYNAYTDESHYSCIIPPLWHGKGFKQIAEIEKKEKPKRWAWIIDLDAFQKEYAPERREFIRNVEASRYSVQKVEHIDTHWAEWHKMYIEQEWIGMTIDERWPYVARSMWNQAENENNEDENNEDEDNDNVTEFQCNYIVRKSDGLPITTDGFTTPYTHEDSLKKYLRPHLNEDISNEYNLKYDIDRFVFCLGWLLQIDKQMLDLWIKWKKFY